MTLIVFLGFSGLLNAQRLESFARGSQPDGGDILVDDAAGEFNFVRVRFNTYFSGGASEEGSVMAHGLLIFLTRDTNFLRGVSRLTNIRVK